MRKMLRRPALLAAALIATAPLSAAAEEPQPRPKQFDFDKFADAAREALDRLSKDLLPYLEELGERMGEVSEYHPPEILPNGDIIIRRKTPLPVPPPEEATEADEDDDVIKL